MEDDKLIRTIEETFWELSLNFFEEEFEGQGVRNNRDIFTPAITAWLMIGQKIISKNSLSGCVDLLLNGKGRSLDWVSASRRVKVHGLSEFTGGICQARKRLAESLVKELADELELRIRQERKNKQEPGTYLLDGTTIVLANTAAIRKEFKAHKNNKRECLPQARVVVAHDLENGVALRPEIDSLAIGEQALSFKLMQRIPVGSVIIADRNFGIFSVAWQAVQRDLKPIIRLQEMRAVRLLGAPITKDGDWNIQWSPSRKDFKGNPDLDDQAVIQGRVIAITMRRKGYRPERLIFFTTMDNITPKELLKLYGKRQLIETDLRTLKYAVKLETVSSKDPSMVRKEIILGVTAYNLICACIARDAKKVGLKPRDISFTRAIDLLQTVANLLHNAKEQWQIDWAMRHYFKGLTQIRHPNRSKIRSEPRKVVRRLKTNFPMMTESRKIERKKLLSRA